MSKTKLLPLKKVLIASSSFYRFPTDAVKALGKVRQKYRVIENQFGRRMTKEELLTAANSCVGIVAGLEEYDECLLKKLSGNLICISRDGVGIDNVDLMAAKRYGISVCNTALAATDAVAELTVGLIVSLLRGIPCLNNDTHQGKWIQNHGTLLQGKTVGIIGVGNIGKRLVKLLKPFGCKFLGNDLKPDLGWFAKNRVSNVSKELLYKNSDVVTLHASFLPGNRHLINSKSFSQMKKGAYFLNVSRGLMVSEKALIGALYSGKIAAAAIDVFEKEPYSGPLVEMDNVILTPHIGASTHESRYMMQLGAINNLLKVLKNV